jgi:hypothetical protein
MASTARSLRERRGKSVKKKIIAKIPRNPLKSLDSDERIQGNPSFSKPQKRVVRGERATSQENPNVIDWSLIAP